MKKNTTRAITEATTKITNTENEREHQQSGNDTDWTVNEKYHQHSTFVTEKHEIKSEQLPQCGGLPHREREEERETIAGPKLESEKETEDSRAFDNLSPNTKKRPLDYKVLKQTQVFSGKKWGTIHFIRDLDPALSEPFKNSRPSVSAQHDALLQENLTDCGFCLAHPKFPAGVYSKIDVKPLKTYKNTDDSIVNRPFEAIVQFGLWRDEQDF
ncbi:Oidioi.mRNA.OKI2018_I69.XSR.g14378.t1.cds [Oikopleura dioica]|uniref:Oidioi.mRNA.OKI2018_I69.XSR.g14378.t1.cds n=1 Tax=Oikopleura dioica TaxID=34765 RepID=A0ABN7SFW8_OIKDI|nr:Oidioi.mRNA.OKI2018_I69.XSR.g14378.t1.cds [Oikopleura dioica]